MAIDRRSYHTMHVSGTTKNHDEQQQQQHRTVDESILERQTACILRNPSCIAKQSGVERSMISEVIPFSLFLFPHFLSFLFPYSRERIGSLSSLPFISIISNDNMAKEAKASKMGRLFVCYAFPFFCFYCEGTTAAWGRGIIM
jgi:hypothetical protein